MRVKVTEQDIRVGKRLDSLCCPLAYAISRASGYLAHVGASTARVGPREVGLPREARAWVFAFDTGMPVEPLEFDLATEEAGQ